MVVENPILAKRADKWVANIKNKKDKYAKGLETGKKVARMAEQYKKSMETGVKEYEKQMKSEERKRNWARGYGSAFGIVVPETSLGATRYFNKVSTKGIENYLKALADLDAVSTKLVTNWRAKRDQMIENFGKFSANPEAFRDNFIHGILTSTKLLGG